MSTVPSHTGLHTKHYVNVHACGLQEILI